MKAARRDVFGGGRSRGRAPLPLVAFCGKCKLDKDARCRSPHMPVWGEGRKGILVIGESPGNEEDRAGRPFHPDAPAGGRLRRLLGACGVDLDEDCWTTNAAVCRPFDEGGKGRNPTRKEVAYCRPNVINAVRDLRPTVLVVLGLKAVESVIGWLWKEDVGDAMGRWAGWEIPCQRLNAWVVPTYHPAALLHGERQPETKVMEMLVTDHLRAAAGRAGTRPWDEVPDYRARVQVIKDDRAAAEAVRGFIARGAPAAFDFECTTLKPDGPHAEIFCCSVSDGTTTVAYPWYGEAVAATSAFIRSGVPKVGQNMNYENSWSVVKLGHPVNNWRIDCMLGMHVLDNRGGITGAKFQAFTLLGLEAYDGTVRHYLRGEGGGNSPNRIREAPLDEILIYCGVDSLVEWNLAQIQAPRLGVALEGGDSADAEGHPPPG